VAADRASRTKALWSGAATVAVLAVVLIVLGLFGPLRSRPASTPAPTGEASTTVTGQTLYNQALEAQASGETTRAAELAQAALVADPSNAAAQGLLDSLNASSGPGAGTEPSEPSAPSTGTAPGSVSDAAFLKKYDDLASLMPTRPIGFSFDRPVQLGSDMTVSGAVVPREPGITKVTWTVHDMKSPSGAASFVTKTSKQLFSKNVASVTIHGVRAHFGTDGTRFATVAFVRGRYAFEVLVSVEGMSPKAAKAIATKAATAFPATPSQ